MEFVRERIRVGSESREDTRHERTKHERTLECLEYMSGSLNLVLALVLRSGPLRYNHVIMIAIMISIRHASRYSSAAAMSDNTLKGSQITVYTL